MGKSYHINYHCPPRKFEAKEMKTQQRKRFKNYLRDRKNYELGIHKEVGDRHIFNI